MSAVVGIFTFMGILYFMLSHTLNACLGALRLSRGSGPVLLEHPIFFVIFQGWGSGPPVHPSGSAHAFSDHVFITMNIETCP